MEVNKFQVHTIIQPRLQFIYAKIIDWYLFIARDPADIVIEDDKFIAQGIILSKYYHEIKLKKENSWLDVNEEDLKDDFE